MKFDFKKLLPHLMVLLLFLVVCVIKFYPQFEGKEVVQGDIVQWKGMAAEMLHYAEKTGEYPTWTNSMFGGMPTYQLGHMPEGNWIKKLDYLFSWGIQRPIGYFLTAMISVYILFLVLGARPMLAAVGGISFAFTTYHFLIYEAGHMTKLYTLAFSGLVVAGVILAYTRNKWGGILLAATGLALNVGANHFQMTYYLGIVVVIIGIAYLIESIKKGRMADIMQTSFFLILVAGIALGTSANRVLPTLEYGQSTMRGGDVVDDSQGKSSSKGGLDWDYAMVYSQGTADLFTFFIPGFAGGSSSEPVSSNSNYAQEMRRFGQPTHNLKAPLYWGGLPGTAGPIYFGALIMLFGVFAMFRAKGALKWGLFAGIVLTVLISFGKNLEGFNMFMFDYFPQFNKFRAVNSVLAITALLSVTLAGVGLLTFINKDENSTRDDKQDIIRIGGGYAGFLLLLTLLGGSFFDMTGAADAQYAQMGLNVDVLYQDRLALIKSDGFRSIFLVLAALAALWFYLKKSLSEMIFGGILVALSLFDLLGVGGRYLSNEDFVSSSIVRNQLAPRAVDDQIMQDKSLSFRVFDLTQSPFNSSFSSLFHHSIGGYHAAKLKRYQDVIDQHLSKNNMAVINMLNTKYFIGKRDEGEAVAQLNPEAYGNAWIPSEINWVASSEEELSALNTSDLKNTVILHNEYKAQVEKLSADTTATIQLTDYHPEHLTYQYKSNAENLVVFSEIWYGPDLGWKLFVDGVETPLIRANYLLRSALIPSGEHTIEMKFEPEIVARGEMISKTSSVIMILLLLLYGFFWYRNSKNGLQEG